ncbi:effector-associated constant component EACC1 [Sphaerisporangium perillae]|uniref:effector-associated constant component EACC1 n=1 Tax=Sphaerisporangium perillae TaxID=2935860 RepID=UPI00200E50D6|nr:hypothetical protein [Sphaerisporangium perillae]
MNVPDDAPAQPADQAQDVTLLLAVEAELPRDELVRDLRRWVAGEPELRGRVRLVEAVPGEGALSGGGVVEALQVIVGTGGAVASLAGIVIAWLGTRKNGEVTVIVSRGGEEAQATRVELSAKNVKGLDLAATRGLAQQAARLLNSLDGDRPEGEATTRSDQPSVESARAGTGAIPPPEHPDNQADAAAGGDEQQESDDPLNAGKRQVRGGDASP